MKDVKVVNIHEGEPNIMKKERFFIMEEFPRAGKVIAAYENAGYVMESCSVNYVPSHFEEKNFTFFCNGLRCVFIKHDYNGEEDDKLLNRLLEEIDYNYYEKEEDLIGDFDEDLDEDFDEDEYPIDYFLNGFNSENDDNK